MNRTRSLRQRFGTNSRAHRCAIGASLAVGMLAGCGGPQPYAMPGAAAPASATAGLRSSSSTYKVRSGLLFVAEFDPKYPYDDIQIYDTKKNDPKPLAEIRDGISEPDAACIDGKNTLYVLNDGSSSISEYVLGDTAPLKTITDGVDYPGFCAIDHHGDLWVTNINAADVTEYLPGATEPHTVITDGIVYPVGIAIDHSGNIYVANHELYGTTNVEVYPPGHTSPSRTIVKGVEWPVGIGVDDAGVLYVTNTIPGNVREYHPGKNGYFHTITQDMNGPAAVTFAKNGWMYVTNGGALGGGSGPPNVILEFPPGSQQPSQRMISDGLYGPIGTAYYPPLLP